MAKQKNRKVSVIGAVLLAAVLGAIIGAVIFHSPGTPLPSPDDVEFKGEYDDSWGKLDKPEPRVTVSQIFVKITPERSDEDAKKHIEQLWHRYKNDPTEEKWKQLQQVYNEVEGNKHEKMPIPSSRPMPSPEFKTVGTTTKVHHARIAKSPDGYHLIRRDS